MCLFIISTTLKVIYWANHDFSGKHLTTNNFKIRGQATGEMYM